MEYGELLATVKMGSKTVLDWIVCRTCMGVELGLSYWGQNTDRRWGSGTGGENTAQM